MLDTTVDAPLRGVVVIPSEFEPIDSILRRFKKACDKSNIIRDHRDHEYFVKPSQRRRQKRLRAARRHGG